MNFFKNKHVIISIIVAPILAICSYYLVDMAVKEHPSQAVAGEAYKLIAKPNCRYSSGACNLENGNFTAVLSVELNQDMQTLLLNANKSLQQVSVGFVDVNGQESGPYELVANDTPQTQWSTEFVVPANDDTIIRVALSANEAHYFSETTMGFSTYETIFKEDFRKQN